MSYKYLWWNALELAQREVCLDTFVEGKAILIIEATFNTFIKFMIKEIHEARIGAECDWSIVKKIKGTKPSLGGQTTEGHI